MFNRFQTRNLAIAFGVLLVLVLLTIPGKDKKNRSFDSTVTHFEPEKASQFHLYPRNMGPRISFRKTGERWVVADSSSEYNADAAQVERMLQSIASLQALRLASREKESWHTYEVTDSLGTRVEVLENGEPLADIVLGRFSYQQPRGPVNPYQQQQGSMTTYVRKHGEKEVYAVDGFLSMAFNGDLDDFRDAIVLQTGGSPIQAIRVQLPEGAYDLNRNDSLWLSSGIQVDSAAMAGYLADLNRQRHPHFLSEGQIPSGSPTHQLEVRGAEGESLVRVDAYYRDSVNIALHSSLNPGTWFDAAKQDLFWKLFKSREALVDGDSAPGEG